MCGRLVGGNKTQAEMLEIIEGFVYPSRQWRVEDSASTAALGYNIAPTQQISILFSDGHNMVASTARWWLVPRWHKGALGDWKATTFNAKLETAAEKPTFREAWRSGRCLIPALGYYEWSGPKNNRQPHFIQVEQNQPFMLFAGLQAQRPDGLRTCTILTRPALPEIRDIHHRMPLVLSAFEAERWLGMDDTDDQVLERYGLEVEHRFRTHRVARFGSRDDGSDLIESIDGFI